MQTFLTTSTVSDIHVLTKPDTSITQLINSVDLTHYKYVHVTNDDVEYLTNGWDTKLIESIKKPYGIVFANDGSNNKHLPALPVMTTNIFKILGWIQLPSLTHLCGDCVWQYIGNQLNCLYYRNDIFIRHNHYLHSRSEIDDTYKKTNSKEMFKKDNEMFKKWIREDSARCLHDLRQGLGI